MQDQYENLKVPPHSLNSERYFLGSILLKSESFHEIDCVIVESDFYAQRHKLIFRAISYLMDRDNQLDVISVSEYLKEIDELENAQGLAYIGTLAKDTTGHAMLNIHANKIIQTSKLRQIISLGVEISEDGYNAGDRSPEEIISYCGAGLDSILSNSFSEDSNAADINKLAIETIAENIKQAEAKGVTGVPMGLPKIDRLLGGFQKQRFYIVGADTGAGKTAFTNQACIYSSMRGYTVGIFSLEMGKDELGIRSMAYLYQVDGSKLIKGDKAESINLKNKIIERKELNKSLLSDAKLHVDTDTYNLDLIVAKATQWNRKHNLDFLLIDHIGLVETDNSKSRNDQMGLVSRTFKKLSKRLDCSVVAVSQINRNSKGEKRRPRKSDLRDSGNLEQDADGIILLYTDPSDLHTQPTPVHISLDKVRYGRSGWITGGYGEDQPNTTPFLFDGKKQTFIEVDYNQEPDNQGDMYSDSTNTKR